MPSRRPRAIADAGEPTARGSLYHILYTLTVCAVGMSMPFVFGSEISATEWLTIVPTFLLANIVEYGVHRWLMHRHIKYMAFMLKLHMVHHNYFDEAEYYLRTFQDYKMVVFPPVVLNMLTLFITLPLAYVAFLVAGKNVALLFIATVMLYYLLMQILHVFAHTAKNHWIHRVPGIDYLRIHHNIHHDHDEMTRCNYNFVIPLSDWLFDTSNIQPRSRLTGAK